MPIKSKPQIEEAMRLGWVQGINAVGGEVTSGLRDWIYKENYFFSQSVTPVSFSIQPASPDSFLRALAYDASRMSCSSIETILSVKKVDLLQKSMAWLAVKLYYAAFYAAHALIRFQGVSCTQLDVRETQRLASIARAYGVGNPHLIASGYYAANYDSGNTTLTFQKSNLRGGGSHEFLWSVFSDQLDVLKIKIAQSPLLVVEAQAAISKLDNLKSVLGCKNCVNGNWLSAVRNEISYRHSYGLWFPHSHTYDHEQYFRLIRTALKSNIYDIIITPDESIDSFIRACLIIVNMMISSISDMEQRHPQGNSFQRFGPLKIKNLGRL